MSFFLGSKKPGKLAKSLSEALARLDEDDGKRSPTSQSKQHEKINTLLNDMCVLLYGEIETEAKPDHMKKLIPELLNEDTMLLMRLLQSLQKLDLSARKHVEKIFCFLIQRGRQNNTVTYIQNHPEIFDILIKGYDTDLAMQCGPILRACIDIDKELTKQLLYSGQINKFFEIIKNDNFDITSDAFNTFKLLLTKWKSTAAKFLDANYDEFLINRFNNDLMLSENFVTRRDSLQLLYEIFKEPKCHKIMKRYIADPSNLKLIMNRFREKSVMMQYAVFHVFKFFVANNRQPPAVSRILWRNREQLVNLLNKLTKDDARFLEEKDMLLDCLNKLEPPHDRTASEEIYAQQVSKILKKSSSNGEKGTGEVMDSIAESDEKTELPNGSSSQ